MGFRVRERVKPFQKLGYEFGDLGFRWVNCDFIFIVVIYSKLGLKMHPGSSSSCSGWRKQDSNVVSGGGRGGCSNGGPICYCGMKSVLRTARTIKNRGKQFWGCSKFKVRFLFVLLVVHFISSI